MRVFTTGVCAVPRSVRVALALGLLLDPGAAQAYIDPGTGSALFYVVTGIVVSIYFGVRSLYYRIIELVFRVRHKDQRCEVALHCEDARYEITFLPVIRQLIERGIEPALFTMYERDDSYEPLPKGVVHRSIPAGMVGYAYLNNIEATLLVTTTPQLDVMTFRRSKRVRHYAMLQHALGESRFVRPYAYDYFDSVFCCGELLKQNIRRMEAIRGSAPKELLETGVPQYEELFARARTVSSPDGVAVVLVAPSWGPLSMFEAFGTDFVELIARHFQVIVRPHPQMKVSQPALYAKILALHGVEIDTARTPSGAMARSHILLSDISGIAHEFAFIYERPVLVMDRQQTLGGLEGELLGGDSEIKQRCSEFIVPVPPEQMPDIVGQLRRALDNHSVDRLRRVRSELVFNFANAGAVAGRQLAEIYRREQAAARKMLTTRSAAPPQSAPRQVS